MYSYTLFDEILKNTYLRNSLLKKKNFHILIVKPNHTLVKDSKTAIKNNKNVLRLVKF